MESLKGASLGYKVAGVKVYPRQNQNILAHAVTACKYYVTSRGDNSVEIIVTYFKLYIVYLRTAFYNIYSFQ